MIGCGSHADFQLGMGRVLEMNNEQNAKLVELTTLSHIIRPKAPEAQVSTAQSSTDVNGEDDLLRAVMARVAIRDENALADLYDISSSRLFAVAGRIAGDTAAAEEIVSDVLLQVWQRGELYDPDGGRVMVWLLTLCRSRALDWRRRCNDVILHHDSKSLRAETAQPEDDPYALISLYKTGTPLYAAVKMLNERERYLVGLVFFRGLTHQEICEHTAMPMGLVKTVLRNALSVIRERLHHRSIEEEPR